ncbi:MAG: glycosyltransferase family 39 protein [Streptosporangiaceae bacterium]
MTRSGLAPPGGAAAEPGEASPLAPLPLPPVAALTRTALAGSAPARPGAVRWRPLPPGSAVAGGLAAGCGRALARAGEALGAALADQWPLTLILTAQAVLSARLIGSNTAFADEALYLWAGHAELAHLLHGAGVPPVAGYFSGAPVLYPPVGAIADGLGGLAAARLLADILMVTATWLLHDTTRRLFGPRAALLACGLFAGLGSTQFLGALATYDSLALCLLALATWLGVKAAAAGPGRRRLAAGAAAMLALASATKYAAAIFDPVVIGIAAASAWRERGAAAGVRTAMLMSWTLSGLLTVALLAAGGSYWRGVELTTLDRPAGSFPALLVWYISGRWVGAVALLAVIGAAVAVSDRQPPRAMTGVLLAAAVFLASAEQARIHTLTSLVKHVGYGAWFGCPVAGYALASLARAIPPAKAAAAGRLAVAAVLLAALPGVPLAAGHYRWPGTAGLLPAVRAALAGRPGPVLASDDGEVLRYYLPGPLSGRPVTGTWYFEYTDPVTGRHLTGLPAYADAIAHRYFAAAVLSFWDTRQTELAIEHDLAASPDYRLTQAVPYSAGGAASDYLIYVRDTP